MTDNESAGDADEIRLDFLTSSMIQLVDAVCPDLQSKPNVRTALAACSSTMTTVFIAMGRENLPAIESICRDVGAELLRQVRDYFEQEDADATARH